MVLPLVLGWNKVTLAQAADSRVGGAWSESCESNEVELGVRETGGPVISVPPDFAVPATGPKGALVTYPDVTAVSVSGAPVPVTCAPAVRFDLPYRTEPRPVHRDRSGHREGRAG